MTQGKPSRPPDTLVVLQELLVVAMGTQIELLGDHANVGTGNGTMEVDPIATKLLKVVALNRG